ncbi:MAG: FkbM family methyltransferase, partial [Chloroflexota bacterium]
WGHGSCRIAFSRILTDSAVKVKSIFLGILLFYLILPYSLFFYFLLLKNEISLIKKAVSNDIRTAEFIVPTTVQGTEPGWEQFVGYSSVGFLSSTSTVTAPKIIVKAERYLKSWIRSIYNILRNRPRHQALKVETTTIDTEFPNDTIDFMKIDVQGAEENVLLGAHTMLQENRIRILYIEWSGEQEIIEILTRYGYEIYDSTYLVGPKIDDMQPFKDIGFECIKKISLSTGKLAYDLIIADDTVSASEAIRAVKKRRLGWIQTDLIAVSRNGKNAFLKACHQYSAEQANQSEDSIG